MKFVSWNVNGIRACLQKDFLAQFDQMDADFFCLQETKLSEGQLELSLPGYEQYWCYAQKKGYSGTAVFTKHTPISVRYGLGIDELDSEGRLITLEYPEFFLVNCYTPNAQRGLARIDHRLKWDDAFRAYISRLDAEKPVIVCGDLNVAHNEIDLKNPKSNRGNAGFSDEERQSFQKTLDAGFVDTFRHLHPDARDQYSWWSYMFHARENNAGWRIDYFLTSERLRDHILRADIHSQVFGSDHCPVSLHLDISCNGGIWSPLSQGKSAVTNGMPEQKKPKAKTTAKAIVPLAVICFLVLAAALLFPGQEKDPNVGTLIWPDYFTVHCTALKPQLVSGEFTSIQYDGELYYLKEPCSDPATKYSGIWLRLELTADGKSVANDTWEVSFIPTDPSISIFSPLIIGEADILPYYTDPGCTVFGGWIVCCSGNTNQEINISITNGVLTGQKIMNIASAFPEVMLQRNITVSEVTSAPYFSPGSEQEFVLDGHVYYAERPSNEMSDACFWINVQPNYTIWHILMITDMNLSASVTCAPGIPQVEDPVFILPYYDDNQLSNQVGWLIYSHNSYIESVDIALTIAREGSHKLTWQITPTIRESMTELSTDALLDRLYEADALRAIIVNQTEEFEYIFDTPIIKELLTRPDAVEMLMNKETSIGYSIPTILLSTDQFRSLMSPEQERNFLLGQYATCSKSVNLSVFKDNSTASVTKYSTEFIIEKVLLNTTDHYNLLLECKHTETQLLLLDWFKLNHCWLAELLRRDDALETMQNTLQYNKNICGWLIENWHLITSDALDD